MTESIVIEVGGEETLSPQQREDAMQSVRAMATPAIESRNRAFEREAAAEELARVLNGPLMALYDHDEKVRLAADETRPMLSASPDWHLDWVETAPQADSLRDDRTSFTPPFHFPWNWHRVDGCAPNFVRYTNAAGALEMEGAGGPLAPSVCSFVEVHAGFGLGFHAPRDGMLVATSDRRFMKVIYDVAAFGVGSWAVAEGGTECSIMSQGEWKAGESRKLFHKKVSLANHERYESNLFGDGLMRHAVPVQAGRDYQFNVGAWLFVDTANGTGQAGATAKVRLEVPILELYGP